MKSILATGLLLILFVCTSHAQSVYSVKNLEQSSQEDLALYLEKALKLKKTGKVLSIAGSATTVAGFLIVGIGGEAAFYPGFPMMLIGLPVTMLGLPILATGASRIKKISRVSNGAITIDLSPCTIYNYNSQNYQPGIKFCLNF